MPYWPTSIYEPSTESTCEPPASRVEFRHSQAADQQADQQTNDLTDVGSSQGAAMLDTVDVDEDP
jgi:hypothetical protein